MRTKIRQIHNFLGTNVLIYLGADIVLGFFWFAIESGFLLVFQGFLVSLGVIDLKMALLPSWYPKTLELNLGIFLLFGIARSLLIGIKKHLPVVASNSFILDQRLKIMSRAFDFDNKSSTAQILSLFGDVSNKAGQFVLHVTQSLSMIISLICLVVFSLKLAFYETILGVFLLFILMMPLKIFNKKIRSSGDGLLKEWDEANLILVNGINNIFLLTIYNVIKEEFSNARRRLLTYEKHYKKYSVISSVVLGVPVFLGVIIIVIVTYVSRKLLLTDSFVFVGFLYLFLRISQMASNVGASLSHVLFYRKAFLHLYEFTNNIDYQLSLPEKKIFSGEVAGATSINFKNVIFSYRDSKILVSDLTFSIPRGGFLLIKGASGSGKSTIIKLMMGLIKPQVGDIKMNDKEPATYLQSYFNSIGYVGPEPFLIPGTLKENILYGNSDSSNINESQIMDALYGVGLESLVSELKSGLNEFLFEDTQLSTGQKQRISFARALLRNPGLLILDEATANIDSETEKKILESIKSKKGRVTIVAISHRPSFDELADELIILGDK